MHAHVFLVSLATVFGVAAVAMVIFQRLKQPVVLGYLLAGLLVGPNVPIPLVADEEVVRTLAEIGVILLMFSLGLEFSLKNLVRVASTGGPVALVEASLMIWAGLLVGWALGWSDVASLFLGACIAISSTSVIAKTFEEHPVPERQREVVFGVLVAEDLFAILLLAVLTPLAAGASPTAEALGLVALRLGAFLIALVAVGWVVVPPVIRLVVAFGRPEVTLVASVGLCFAVALLASTMGYSVALGAFLAGSLVAESRKGHEVEVVLRPVRDLFAAVFFVSVGMLIDPAVLVRSAPLVAALTVTVLVGKIGAVSLSSFLVGNGVRTSVEAGMSLAQIGEFSFIIAELGRRAGVVPDALLPAIVAVAAITAFTTPYAVRAADRVAFRVEHRLPRPIATFAALYGGWIEQLRARMGRASIWSRIRRPVLELVVDAVVIVGVVIAHDVWSEPLAQRIAGDEARAAWWAITAAAMLFAALPTVALFRGSRRLGATLATLVRVPDLPALRPGATRRLLGTALQLGVLLVVGLPMVALTQPFLPPLQGFLVLGACEVGVAVLVWRRAVELQGELGTGAGALVAAILRPPAHATPVPEVDIGAGPVLVRLDAGSPAVGRTLVELDVRAATGATVLAIADAMGRTSVPTGREALRAGDRLALAGSVESVRAARALLGG